MRFGGLFLFLLTGFGTELIHAGSVSFTSQAGSYFSFQNLKEEGPNVPPSNLQSPSLFTNPRDTIRFVPSAFVAVESQLGSMETASLSSTLSFLVQATAALPMEKLFIDLSGTYAEHSLGSAITGGASPVLATSLSLEPIQFTIGGVTKTWSPALNVLRSTSDQTWSGSLEITKADLRALFNAPTMDVTQFEIQSVATVSATAQWGNASSYLTTLSFGVQPIPEPSTTSLCLWGVLLGLKKRRKIHVIQ